MFEFFSDLHWLVLLKIVLIDIVMGVDNALIIAMAVSALALNLRNKAIILGTAGAILARILFLFIGFWLVGLPLVKALAGGYLIYLGYNMLTSHEEDVSVAKKATIWGATVTIVMADLMMSLDNVVALVGASEGTGDHAFGYTVFGILLSIPIIVLASKVLIKLLDKYPILMWFGAGLIVWVGIEMLLKEPFILTYMTPNTATIIGLLTVVLTLGLAYKMKNSNNIANV